MQDKNKQFSDLLKSSGLTQAELSDILGLTPAAVSRWHKIGVPKYAVAYLTLLAKYKRLLEKI